MPEPDVKIGSILWARVCDPNTGQQLQEHPVVVLSRQAEIDAGDDLRVVVCTTSFTYPLKDGWFALPNQPGGEHPTTGFGEAGVAKATWTQRIPQSQVSRNPGKRAPMKIVKQIIQWLRDKSPDFL